MKISTNRNFAKKKKHTEILELKNTTIKLKILLEKFTIRLEQIEEKNQ